MSHLTRVIAVTVLAIVAIAVPVRGQFLEGGVPMPLDAAQQYEVLAAKINNEIQTACAEIAYLEDATFTDRKKLAEARVALRTAESRYRATMSVYLRGAVNGYAPKKAKAVLEKGFRDADDYLPRRLESLNETVVALLLDDGTSERKIRQWGAAEGRLRVAMIETDALLDAWARVDPIDWSIGIMPGVEGVNRNAVYLNQLMVRIGTIDPDEPAVTPGADAEFKAWLQKRYQRAMIDQYRHLAMHSLMVDPATRRPLTGPIRTKAAGRSMECLAEHLKVRHQFETGVIERMFYWGTTREDLGKEIEAELKQWTTYQIARFTAPSIVPDAKEYMLAAAVAIRAEQTRINTWYTKVYLGRDDESTTALGEYFEGLDSNLDQWFRAGDFDTWDDQTRRSAVQRRIRWFMRETDAAADALTAAGTAASLHDLTDAQRRLLQTYGFMQKTATGDYVLIVSHEGRRIGSRLKQLEKRLDLPGASWLSIISPETIAITAASVIVPELAGARIAAWAEGAIASERAIVALRILTEVTAGTATDAVIELAQHGRIDVEKLVRESLVLGGVLQLSGKASEKLVNHAMRRMAARESASALTLALREDKVFREALEAKLSAVLSLGAETSLTAAYQGVVDGAELDVNAVLSIATQSLVARVIGEQMATGSLTGRRITREHVLSALPPELQRHFKAHPEALEHVARAAEAQRAREAEAQQAYDRIDHDPTPVDVFWALIRGDLSWTQLKLLYAADVTGRREMMVEIKKQRDEFFDGIVHDARILAQRELAQAYDQRLLKLEAEGASDAAIEALFREYSREVDLINEPLVAPGSGDPTSDIDRSARSNWMRRALRQMYELRAHRVLETDPPASLHAVDVNEYINVFPLIASNREHVRAMANQPATEMGFPCSHSEAMEARSLSGAMRHMTAEQRARFKENRIGELLADLKARNATEDAAWRAEELLRRQLDWAENDVNLAERHIEATAERLATERGVAADDPKVLLDARDTVYGERMDEINRDVRRLERMDPQTSPEAIFLRATIERKLSTAMRDGIETYAHPTGLDIVVTEVQSKHKTDKDGTVLRDDDGNPIKMKVSDRLEDPNFTLGGELSHYSERDINGILNDQIMFVVEHANHYNHGHETSYEAGRALGKYLERAFLAMKIKGLDIAAVRARPKSDPTRRLLEFSQALAKSKGSPNDLNAVLAQFAMRSPRTADQGMLELFRLTELVMPGMQGLTGSATPRGPGGLAVITPDARRGRVLVQRRRDKREQAIDRRFGAAMLLMHQQAEAKRIRHECALLEGQLARMRRLADDHLIKDVEQLLAVDDRVRGTTALLASVPTSYRYFSGEFESLRRDRARRDALRSDRIVDPQARDARLASIARGYARRLDRLRFLQSILPEAEQRTAKTTQRLEALKRFAALKLGGSWQSPVGASAAHATVRHDADHVEIDVTWPNRAGNGPHVRIDARRRGDRLVGVWIDLSRRPSTYEQQVRGATGRVAGVFEAVLSAAGDAIEVSRRTTDHPRLARGRGAIEWHGVVFRRHATAHQTAARGWMDVTTEPIPQVPNGLPRMLRGDEIPAGKGRLVLDLKSGDSSWLHADFDVYRAGTDEWVEYGNTGSALDLPPGTYDVRFPGRTELDQRGVTIGSGAVQRAGALQLGHLAVRVPDADGGHRTIPVGRVMRDGVELKERRALPPGTYDVTFEFAGRRFTRPVTISGGSVSAVTLRPATIDVNGTLADGTAVEPLLFAFAPGERSTPLRRTTAGAPLVLAPGTYDVRISFRGFEPLPHETIERTALEVDAGATITLEARWSRLVLNRAGPSISFAYRAGADVEGDRSWLGTLPDVRTIDLAPGAYVVRWTDGEREERRAVTLSPGQVLELDVRFAK